VSLDLIIEIKKTSFPPCGIYGNQFYASLDPNDIEDIPDKSIYTPINFEKPTPSTKHLSAFLDTLDYPDGLVDKVIKQLTGEKNEYQTLKLTPNYVRSVNNIANGAKYGAMLGTAILPATILANPNNHAFPTLQEVKDGTAAAFIIPASLAIVSAMSVFAFEGITTNVFRKLPTSDERDGAIGNIKKIIDSHNMTDPHNITTGKESKKER
jgi:hypothetical protein